MRLLSDDVLPALEKVDLYLRERYGVSAGEALLLSRKEGIPIVIFCDPVLGPLEALVKYLKENLGYRYSEIARFTGRDQRTIWCSYANAKRKKKARFSDSGELTPLPSFLGSSILGAVICHLIDEKKHSYKAAAAKLKRNYQTIYTTYRKVKRR